MYVTLAVLAAFAAVYSIIAGRLERTWISGAIVFTAFGLLIGPMGLSLPHMDADWEGISLLAELTLALVLFTDAAGADIAVLRRTSRLPIRLLAVGLPLTILLGFGAGKLLFGAWTVYEIALLATMLAPTDAALGKAVVTNEAVPAPMRQGLNVESGLNDGICVPVLLLFLTLVAGTGGEESTLGIAFELLLKAVGIGAGVGVALTVVAVVLLKFCVRNNWISPTWAKMTVIGLAFACFATAQALGGSGFIASFVGGMLFGTLFKPDHEKLLGAAEGIGDTFGLLTWVVFGAAVVPKAFDAFSWQAIVYAVLSLTVIRMLPVFLVVTGLKASTEDKLFMGWFGPRGLASIVFAVMVLDANVEHGNQIASVAVWTIILSVVAHGVTANPWAKRLGAREG